MSRWIPLVIAGIVGVGAAVYRGGCANRGFDGSDVRLEPLKREHFIVDVPKGWRVAANADETAIGNHKREYKSKEYVEISWTAGEPLSADELKIQFDAIVAGLGFEKVSEKKTTSLDFDRLEAVLKIAVKDKTGWLHVANAQCQKTNVNVIVFVAARDREAATVLGQRMGKTLHCVGESAVAVSRRADSISSDLDEAWVYASDADAERIGRKDNAAILVVSRTTAAIHETLEKHPQEVAKMFGSLMDAEIKVAANSFRKLKGLAGADIRAVAADGVTGDLAGGKVGIGSLQCRNAQGQKAYVLFSFVEADAPGDPVELFSHLGCPGAGTPISEFESGCALGLVDFCDEPADAPADGEPAHSDEPAESDEPADDDAP